MNTRPPDSVQLESGRAIFNLIAKVETCHRLEMIEEAQSIIEELLGVKSYLWMILQTMKACCLVHKMVTEARKKRLQEEAESQGQEQEEE